MRDYLGQLRYRLLESGCAGRRIRRMVGEVADHRDDLIQAGLIQGMTDVDAQIWAEQRLGSPSELAESAVLAQRRSTWFGRHFLVMFGFLPLVAFPLMWGLFLGLGLWLEAGIGFGWDSHKLHLAGDNPVTFRYWANAAYGMDYLALVLSAATFCWLARRWAVSFTWMTIACLIGSVYAAFSFTYVQRHNYSLGITDHLHWMRAVMPLLVVGVLHLNRWRLMWGARRTPAI